MSSLKLSIYCLRMSRNQLENVQTYAKWRFLGSTIVRVHSLRAHCLLLSTSWRHCSQGAMDAVVSRDPEGSDIELVAGLESVSSAGLGGTCEELGTMES